MSLPARPVGGEFGGKTKLKIRTKAKEEGIWMKKDLILKI
jgi:hypothetical protein